jgi:hypothetical protein
LSVQAKPLTTHRFARQIRISWAPIKAKAAIGNIATFGVKYR